MSLTIREQSEQLQADSAARLPADVVEVFSRNAQQLHTRGVPAGAVKAGDTLASFTLRNAVGGPVSLDDLAASGPAVLVFYRGSWCPYCNLALRTYQRELLPQLDAWGATLAAISPQTPDQSLSTAEKAALSFEVLSDPSSRLARRIGIAFEQGEEVLAAQRKLGLDLVQVNQDGSTELPMPTVLIVDPDRTVRFAEVHPDYTTRTEVADIIAALADVHAETD
ncbi:MAG: peroxiredoxin-like family protein [Mycobacterium sp.]|uniref:peroxiredoxin-like family protein n=1 Tax=Mycobacterium sp. TaxID=1785 RepID=UPI003BB6B0E6